MLFKWFNRTKVSHNYINCLLGSWTEINIWKWVLKTMFYFTVVFDKKHIKPPGKYLWNDLPWKKSPPRHYTLGCLFQKLILHSHNRIFKLRKLLKARNTFSHKIKPKKLKNKSYFGRRSHKKCDCQYCSAKWVLHNQDIWKYSKLLNVFIIYLKYHGNLTNKQNIIITTYKQLLGTCIKSKTATYIYSMCQIILQKFSKVTN